MKWNRVVTFVIVSALVIGGLTAAFSGNAIGDEDETVDDEMQEDKSSVEGEEELSPTDNEERAPSEKIQKQKSPLDSQLEMDSEPPEGLPEKVREKPPGISPEKRGSNIRESEGYEVNEDDFREKFERDEIFDFKEIEEGEKSVERTESVELESGDYSLTGKSGPISGTPTWSGTINVTSDVYVQAGATLTIDPGTEIYFSHTSTPDPDPTLYINGTLQADGSSGEITFTSNATKPGVPDDPSRGDWGGIYFHSSADETNSFIDHANISYADRGVSFDGASPPVTYCNVTMNNYGFNGTEMNVSHNNITDNGNSGVYVGSSYGMTGDYDIHHNTIVNNSRGIYFDSPDSRDEQLFINLTNNDVNNNDDEGIQLNPEIAPSVDESYSFDITVDGNRVLENGGDGLVVALQNEPSSGAQSYLYSNVTLTGNNGSDNQGIGIGVASEAYANNGDCTIRTDLTVDSNAFYNNANWGLAAYQYATQNNDYNYTANMTAEVSDNTGVNNTYGSIFSSEANKVSGGLPISEMQVDSWNNRFVNNSQANIEVTTSSDAGAYSNITANFDNEEVIGHNRSQNGILLDASGGGNIDASVSNSYIYNNTYGINSIGAEVGLTDNDILENGYTTTGMGVRMVDNTDGSLTNNIVNNNGRYGVYTDGSSTADWYVGKSSEVYNNDVLMNGNVTVMDSGEQSWKNGTMDIWNVNIHGRMESIPGSATTFISNNVTVYGMQWMNNTEWKLDSSSPGEYHINVTDTGHLVIQDESLVTSDTGNAYEFWVQEGGELEVYDSRIEQCGWDSDKLMNTGLWLDSDNVMLDNATVLDGYKGLIVNGTAPEIRGSAITNNDDYGIDVRRGSNLKITDRSIVTQNNRGINAVNARLTLENSSVSSNDNEGLYLREMYSSRIVNNIINENDDDADPFNSDGIQVIAPRESIEIRNNEINENTKRGVYSLGEADLQIENNTIYDNAEHGIHLQSSDEHSAGLKYSNPNTSAKLTYFSFGFEAINGENTRNETMDNTLTWLNDSANSVLLVDDDGGEDYEGYYNTSLSYSGFGETDRSYWDTSERGTPPNETLEENQTVIWFTADETDTLNGSERTNLTEFFRNGGELFLSGQNIGDDIGTDPFYTSKLKADYRSSNSGILDNIAGNSGDAISDGLNLNIRSYSGDGVDYRKSPEVIELQDGAEEIFFYDQQVESDIYENNITYNGRDGIRVEYSNPAIYNNENISYNGQEHNANGIYWTDYDINATIHDNNRIVNNTVHGITFNSVEGDLDVVSDNFHGNNISDNVRHGINGETPQNLTLVLTGHTNTIEDNGHYGIKMDAGGHADVELQADVIDNGYSGVYVYSGDYIQADIYDSNFSSNGRNGGWLIEQKSGLYMESDDNLTASITNTEANDNGDGDRGCGILGWAAENCTVTLDNVEASNNDYLGIYLVANSGDLDIVEATDIIANENGDGTDGYGIGGWADENLTAQTLDNVTASNNDGYGIYLGANSGDLDIVEATDITANENGDDDEGYGIYAYAGEKLTAQKLDNVTASNNDGYGIYLGANSALEIVEATDITANENGNDDWGYGIYAYAGEKLTATFDNVNASNNDEYGIYSEASANLTLTMRESNTSYNGYGNWGNGTYFESTGGNSSVTFDNVTVSHNDGYGIYGEADWNITMDIIGEYNSFSYNDEDGVRSEAMNGYFEFDIRNSHMNNNSGGMTLISEGYLNGSIEKCNMSMNRVRGVQLVSRGDDVDVDISECMMNDIREPTPGGLARMGMGIWAFDGNVTVDIYDSSFNHNGDNSPGLGIDVSASENLTADLEKVRASRNNGTGLHLVAGYDLDILEATEITANENGGRGIFGVALDGDITATLGEVVEASDNDDDGIHLRANSGDLEIVEATDVKANENGGRGIYGAAFDGNVTATLGEVVEASDNDDDGIRLIADSDLEIVEATDVKANENGNDGGGYGIYANAGENITATLGGIEASRNNGTGLHLVAGYDLDILEATEITANENGGRGIFGVALDGNVTATLGEVVEASDNDDDGIHLRANSGDLEIVEATDVKANENGGRGIYGAAFDGNVTTTLVVVEASDNDDDGIRLIADSDLEIVEATDIKANENGNSGVYLESGAHMIVDIDQSYLIANGRDGGSAMQSAGLYMDAGGNLTASITNTEANENGNDDHDSYGIYGGAGENLIAQTLEGLTASDNYGYGIYLEAGSDLEIVEATDVQTNYNRETGIFVEADDSLSADIYNGEVLKNGGNGIVLESGANMTLYMSTTNITHNDDSGIRAASGEIMDAEISNNNVESNGDAFGGRGVYLYAGDQMTLHMEENDIHKNNGYGLNALSEMSMEVNITANYFGENDGTGAYLGAGSHQEPVNGTIGETERNRFVKNGEDGLSIDLGGDLLIDDNIMENNEDTGLRMVDSLYYRDVYEDGEIVTRTARPVIVNNVISNNGNTSHATHPGLGIIDLNEANGIYLASSSAVITDNEIENNWNNGVALEDSGWTEGLNIEFEDNVVRENYVGITSQNSAVEIKNNVITYNRGSGDEGGGIYSTVGSTVNLVNNEISYNQRYGVYTGPESRTDWLVTDDHLVVHTNAIVLRGDLEVDGGGLYLEDVSGDGLAFRNSRHGRFGISVSDDGVFEAKNTRIDAYEGSDSYTFELNNAYLTLENCYVSGQRSLDLESSEFTIYRTQFSDASHGALELQNSSGEVSWSEFHGNSNFDVYLEDSVITLKHVAFRSSAVGIEAVDSDFTVEDGDISAINEGIRAQGDTWFEVYNSSFGSPVRAFADRSDYEIHVKDEAVGYLYNITDISPGSDMWVRDDARIEVYWNVRVKVVDVFGEAVEDEDVYVEDMNGTLISQATTDWNGRTEEIRLHANTYYNDSVVEYSPYSFTTEERESVEVINGYAMIELGPDEDPEFISTPPTNATQGSEYYYNPNAVDPSPPVGYGGINLRYSLVEKPEGMTINPETGQITWIPDRTQDGVYNVTLRVQNLEGRYAMQTWSIDVESVNYAPIITSEAPSEAYEGVEYEYHVEAMDSDGDMLNYSLVQSPAGMEIDSADGLITWTPTPDQVRNHTVILEVSDGNETTRQEFVVTVLESGEQTFLTDPSVSRDAGTTEDTYTFTVIYRDVNGQAPEGIYAVIDGEWHEMTQVMGDDYAKGVTYEYETTLDSGTINYYFAAETGDGEMIQTEKGIVEVSDREAPSLTNPSVSRDAGTTEDTYTFTVIYTDVYGYAPKGVYAVIDGERYEMTQVLGDDYATGVTYEYETTLDSGTINYYFLAETEEGYMVQSEKGVVEVSEREAPSLTDPSVSRDAGTTDDTYTFTVIYTDVYGYEPKGVYAVIDGERYEMTQVLGDDYSKGVTYEYETSLESGTINYYFAAETEDGETIQSEKGVLEVSEREAPSLTNPSVSRDTGTTEDTYTFTVTYKDVSGQAPKTVYVVIGGERHEMTQVLGDDYATGVTYEYEATLDSGELSYYFVAETEEGYMVQSEEGVVEVSEVSEEPLMTNFQIIILLIIVILAIILVLYYLERRERSEEEEPPAEEEPVMAPQEEAEEEPTGKELSVREEPPTEEEPSAEEEPMEEEPPVEEEQVIEESELEEESMEEEPSTEEASEDEEDILED